MAIEGTEEIVLTFRFRCPPGIPPEHIAAEIARNGVAVACGLLQLLKETDCRVVPASDVAGPKLHT